MEFKTRNLEMTMGFISKTSLQCQQTENRARCILFQLRRGFAVLTPKIFNPIYLALVGRVTSIPFISGWWNIVTHRGLRKTPRRYHHRRLRDISTVQGGCLSRLQSLVPNAPWISCSDTRYTLTPMSHSFGPSWNTACKPPFSTFDGKSIWWSVYDGWLLVLSRA